MTEPLNKQHPEPGVQADHLVATGDIKPRSRDKHIDALKGFLIMMVVLGHIPIAGFFGNKNNWQYAFFKTGVKGMHIYYFHMPLFFALGVLFVPAFSSSFLKKTAIALLIPYVIWVVQPTILFQPAADIARAVHWAPRLLIGNWHYIQSVLWFLPALFSCKIIFAIAKALQNKIDTWSKAARYTTYTILSIIWMVYFLFTPKIAVLHCQGYIPFGIDIALYLMPYFIALAVLYQNRHQIQRVPLVATLLLAVGATMLITYIEPLKTITKFHHAIDLAQYSMPYTLAGYVGLTVLSGAIIIIFYKLKNELLLKALAFVGIYSYPIFLMHGYIMLRVKPLLVYAHTPNLSLLLWLGTFVCGVAVPIIFSRLLMRISKDFGYAGFVK